MMIKNKISKLLDEYGEFLKRFGIYMLIVLFIFGVSINYMLGKVKDKQNQVINNITDITDPNVNTNIDAIEKPTEQVPVKEQTEDNKIEEQENKEESKVQEKPVTKQNSNKSQKATADSKPPVAKKSAPVTKKENSTPASTEPLKLVWPIKGEVINGYGLRYSQTYADYRLHPGIDIKAKVGTEVVTAAGGKVSLVENSKEQNVTIEIDHGNGWLTRYSHMDKALVKEGKTVKTGAKIGVIGKPGAEESIEGPHLHLEVKQDQQWVDPMGLLKR